MQTADFDFVLPPELIAQTPATVRDQSRLLVLHRTTRAIQHRTFADVLDHLVPGDALVLNDTRVLRARLRGTNARSGGRFDMLLLEENACNDWWAMLRPGRRARIGTCIALRNTAGEPVGVSATVTETNDEGRRRMRFEGVEDIAGELDRLGEMPLPPYIKRELGPRPSDGQRYQTVFARANGSVAAPTAGLHFTGALLDAIRARGIHVCFVTLHVGLGTFIPVTTENIEAHAMHEERFEVSADTVRIVNAARQAGRRVVAVGTTTVRVLESAAQATGEIAPAAGRTRIFIHPPYRFRIVDAMVTNFHLPRSTLLMLVSAFAAPEQIHGRQLMLDAYAEAIRERYRFYSYGDAMLIL